VALLAGGGGAAKCTYSSTLMLVEKQSKTGFPNGLTVVTTLKLVMGVTVGFGGVAVDPKFSRMKIRMSRETEKFALPKMAHYTITFA
jgi:hypothetical protein